MKLNGIVLAMLSVFASTGTLAQTPAAAPASSPGRIFCCDDAKGKRLCSDFLPPECQNRAYEERDNRGFVIKKVDAPLTEAQLAKRRLEQAKKEEEAKRVLEERRRMTALLSTYSNERDIDRARDRALAEADKTEAEAQRRLDEASKKKLKLDKDKDFYKGKELPPEIKAQITENDKELKAQQTAIEKLKQEKVEINRKFADEKRRFFELTGKKTSEPVVIKQEVVVPNEQPVAAPPSGTAQPAQGTAANGQKAPSPQQGGTAQPGSAPAPAPAGTTQTK